MIETFGASGLSFRYGRRLALDSVDVSFCRGVNGLLGPNGAGKTTLLRVMAGTLSPTTGTVSAGHKSADHKSLDDLRPQIGFLPQTFDVLTRQSVQRNVEYAAWARGVALDQIATHTTSALQVTGLEEVASLRAGKLSGGQRQRLGIACAVAHQPAIVILDEPTVGLDPEQRVTFRQMIKTIGARAIVIISTHIVEDLARLEAKLVVLADGRVRHVGVVDDLARIGAESPLPDMSALESGYVHVRSTDPEHASLA